MKKILSILLTLALLLGMGAVGASALNLPKATNELPALFAAGESPFALPKPKHEASAIFAAESAVMRALTENEMYEIEMQLYDLYCELYDALEMQVALLELKAPILVLILLFNHELYLKDGVSLADLNQALDEIEEPILPFVSFWRLFDEWFMSAYLEFFGLDEIPYEGEPGFDDFVDALQAALEDGLLKAALEQAGDALLLEWQASYTILHNAVVDLIKPDALTFAEEYLKLAELENDFLNSVWANFDSLTDAELEALEAIYLGIFSMISEIAEALNAAMMSDNWAQAAALLGGVNEDIEDIITAGLADPLSMVFTLTYDLLGGTGGPTPLKTMVLKNTAAALSYRAPTKSGFTFGGWSATSGGTAAITSILMDGDKTVYAIWTPAVVPPVYCTLTYDANGGTGGPAAQADIPAGTQVDLATTNLPTRAGYNFKGWSESATGTAIVTKVTVNGDKRVYAVWEQKSAFELWKDKLADGKFGGIFKGLANWANWLLYIIFYGLFGWLINLIIK